MTERRLQDAKIVVRVDTSQAERELEQLDNRRGRSEERQEERRSRSDRKREGEGRGRTNVAIIPGTGVLRTAIKTFIQIELVKLGLAVGAGAAREADLPAPFKKVTDILASQMEAASEAIQSLQSQLAAVLGTTGDIIDVARSQKLLTGSVDTAALGRVALDRANVRTVEAALEARRKTVGRAAAGATITDIAGQAVKNIGVAVADSLAGSSLGAPR